ncbi:MAG: oxygen-independent coproporphyrinogen III oxidase [bacterium F082]|nr:MAG: oxygen-independent coproporphyrinogen III oxidase [bacterium F082]KWW28613.1 MAG: oxygen-independent coproporphyrinogen III oxidase [bacterium P201]
MAGIYIHIPFCNSKCAYCGFYSLPSLKLKEQFLEALKAEIVARKDYLKQRSHCGLDPQSPSLLQSHHTPPINTIYFGGGTPSLLSIKEISELLQLIKETYPVAENAEITLEANPDTLSLAYLEGLRQLGVNRLSIGIQSFFDNDLKYLSRRHDSQHARQCIDWAKQAGFSNISIDLIYGLPTSNAEQWNRNLDLFFALDLPHLSAYALTLEPNAILTKQIELGKVQPVNEEDALRDYEILSQRAAENGYLHYEISNFCRRGMHSKHNASYWFGTPYIGFGPSAHSFDGTSRQWNVSSVERYCVRVPEPVEGPFYEKEILSLEQQYDEYVMLRLRTHWGIDLKWLKREMGERFSTYCEQHAQPLIAQGRLSQTREFLYLTDQQMLFADGVAEELFWE